LLPLIDRHPQIVLVDELAHTNVPDSAREKRYQDIDIILAAGIDVLSTVNIQHLESLNDLVAKITGVIVRERIPDPFLDDADELVVVDVTPETLQERLLSGKIYASHKIQQSQARAIATQCRSAYHRRRKIFVIDYSSFRANAL